MPDNLQLEEHHHPSFTLFLAGKTFSSKVTKDRKQKGNRPSSPFPASHQPAWKCPLLLILSFIQVHFFLIRLPLVVIYLELFVIKWSIAMIKVSQRESRSTVRNVASFHLS